MGYKWFPMVWQTGVSLVRKRPFAGVYGLRSSERDVVFQLLDGLRRKVFVKPQVVK